MAGANFIVTILNPNKTPAFNYTALKYFSQLIATGENKINLIFETDSPRESPQPRIPAASERGTTSQRLAWCWVSRFYQRPLHTAHPWPSMGRKIKRGRSLCGSNWCHMFILLNEAWFLGTGGSLDRAKERKAQGPERRTVWLCRHLPGLWSMGHSPSANLPTAHWGCLFLSPPGILSMYLLPRLIDSSCLVI